MAINMLFDKQEAPSGLLIARQDITITDTDGNSDWWTRAGPGPQPWRRALNLIAITNPAYDHSVEQ
jgi:hypothetical protein